MVSAAGDFIDSALQNESSWKRAQEPGTSSVLLRYGTSLGAVRGTVRDASRKFSITTHDEVTALSAELWALPVLERRLAAVVLLQSNIALLLASDLTRIEGFLRSADGSDSLLAALIGDVAVPLFAHLDGVERARAFGVVDRWLTSAHAALRQAATAISG